MNNVSIIGNLVRDPEMRTTASGKSVANFTLAVNRRFKTEGQPTADFISCVLWGSGAEVFINYSKKGAKVGVTGRIQSRSYEDKDGNSRTVVEVVVDQFDFLSQSAGNSSNITTSQSTSTTQVEPDNDLPWE